MAVDIGGMRILCYINCACMGQLFPLLHRLCYVLGVHFDVDFNIRFMFKKVISGMMSVCRLPSVKICTAQWRVLTVIKFDIIQKVFTFSLKSELRDS